MLSSLAMETILHRLNQWKLEAPAASAQKWKVGHDWKAISVSDLHARVAALARFLQSEGWRAGDIGLIYAYNSPAWVQMDLAFMLARGVSAGIYVNASIRQIHYILQHSEARFLVVDRIDSAHRVFQNRAPKDLSPHLHKVIVLSDEKNLPPWATSFADAVKAGERMTSPTFEEMLKKIVPSDRAAMIYTSGTTGQPKAVSLSYWNMAFAAHSYGATWNPPKTGRLFSFLPLAHVAERMVNVGMGITQRYTVWFCSSPMAIAQEMREVQPTIALCVPRLWDKLKEGFENRMAQMPAEQRERLQRAMEISKRYQSLVLQKKPVPAFLRLRHLIADRMILSKIREQLGVSQAKRTASGAAALAPTTLEWYRGIGVRLIEAYALSESSGVLTCGAGDEEAAYTVGRPYPDIELRLGPDGEIETRGPHVFQGYYKDPAGTAEVLKNGWLHTGDIGAIDERGLLRILGRKREIIKNAEGKMISPLYLETLIESSPLVDQAIVIGNERPYLVALITLSENLRPQRPDGATVEDREALDRIKAHVDEINRDIASHERIKGFKVLANPFSIENGEMTATMKLKRRVIEENYAELIKGLYDRGRAAGPEGRT